MNAPIACSLSARDYRRRADDIREISRRALRSTRPVAGGLRLTFADAGGARSRLEALVAAEAVCCPFLTLDLRRSGDDLVLDVTGPEAAQSAIAEVFG